jgi:hypothetical protein
MQDLVMKYAAELYVRSLDGMRGNKETAACEDSNGDLSRAGSH